MHNRVVDEAAGGSLIYSGKIHREVSEQKRLCGVK